MSFAPAGVPDNAGPTIWGGKRRRDRRYQAIDNGCIAVKMPENGYYWDSVSRRGWQRDRGYRAADEICVGVKLPANACLDISGNDSACDRPYRQNGCVLPWRSSQCASG